MTYLEGKTYPSVAAREHCDKFIREGDVDLISIYFIELANITYGTP